MNRGHEIANVVADLSSAPFRTPIVDDDPTAVVPKLGEVTDDRGERQWRLVTGAARRALAGSPAAREVAVGFTNEPLSEELPLSAVSALGEKDPRTAAIAERASSPLGELLSREPVPDGILKPDIRQAPHIKTPEDEKRFMLHWVGTEFYGEQLKSTIDRVSSFPGVTEAERRMVARRYRYARDVKLLGLLAELIEQPASRDVTPEDGLISHHLKSGTTLVVTSEAVEADPNLLDPQKWQSRRQLKDRVYQVVVGDKTYIMKERKTGRHTDTKKGGHRDGLTSKEEFETAREFAGLGTIWRGDVSVRWEEPVGYAEFRDGYQFCLFKDEKLGHVEEDYGVRVRQELSRAIVASNEEYTEEFEEVRANAKAIYAQHRDDASSSVAPLREPKRFPISRRERAYKRGFGELQAQHSRWVAGQPKPDELTFEEFAELRAYFAFNDAQALLENTMLTRGFVNVEGHDGYHMRVLLDGKRPRLETVVFDLEYYKKDPATASGRRQRRQMLQGLEPDLHTMGLGDSRRRHVVSAAAQAMYQRRGSGAPTTYARNLADR